MEAMEAILFVLVIIGVIAGWRSIEKDKFYPFWRILAVWFVTVLVGEVVIFAISGKIEVEKAAVFSLFYAVLFGAEYGAWKLFRASTTLSRLNK